MSTRRSFLASLLSMPFVAMIIGRFWKAEPAEAKLVSALGDQKPEYFDFVWHDAPDRLPKSPGEYLFPERAEELRARRQVRLVVENGLGEKIYDDVVLVPDGDQKVIRQGKMDEVIFCLKATTKDSSKVGEVLEW